VPHIPSDVRFNAFLRFTESSNSRTIIYSWAESVAPTWSLKTTLMDVSNSNDVSNRHPPVLIALASQATAFILCFGLALVIKRQAGLVIDLPLILAGQGVFAAIIGLKLGLQRWWLPLQLILPAAGGAALMLALPSWIFLAVFIALVLVFWNASSERVPLYLTNRHTWEALAGQLPKGKTKFIDIGCGVGGTLTYLANACPQAHISGIESAPIPYALAWLRIRFSGLRNITLLYGDFWKHNLEGYDLAYVFLSPTPMGALYEKAKSEMQHGAALISNSFAVPDHLPDETLNIEDRRQTQLLIWRM
jgi:hypothetical protein